MGGVVSAITGSGKKKKNAAAQQQQQAAERARAAEAQRLSEQRATEAKALADRKERLNAPAPVAPSLDEGTSNQRAILARRGRSGLVAGRRSEASTRSGVAIPR